MVATMTGYRDARYADTPDSQRIAQPAHLRRGAAKTMNEQASLLSIFRAKQEWDVLFLWQHASIAPL